MVINNLSDILVWFPARILWEIKERAYSTKKESKKLTCRWLYRSSLAGPPLLEGKRDSLDFNLLLESTRSGPRFFRNTGTGKPKDLLSFSNNSTLIRLTNLLWGWTRRRSLLVVLITFVMCLKFRLRRWWWNGGIGIVVGKEVFSKDPWSCDCSCQENLPHFCEFLRTQSSEWGSPTTQLWALNLGWWGEWFDLTCFPLSIFCIQLLTFLPPPSSLVV